MGLEDDVATIRKYIVYFSWATAVYVVFNFILAFYFYGKIWGY